MLCRSIDRFAPDIPHALYVPQRDMAMFSVFASPRRTIRRQEELLARWFWKAPLPGPEWRRKLRLPRRNVYLTPWPVRGWIAQQIMKISASLAAETDIVAHLDSDIVLVRQLTRNHFVRDGLARFFAQRAPHGIAGQQPWYAAANTLLGLPARDLTNNLYIDQFVVWRRSVAEALVARIEATTGLDWVRALARTPAFAEYVLYGVFVDELLGADAAGVYEEPRSLCYSRWSGRIASAEEEDAFIGGLRPDQVACLIQSTIPMATHERARVFGKATQWAANADALAT